MNLDFVTAHNKDLAEQTHSAVLQWHTTYHSVLTISQYAKFNGIENIKKYFFSERKNTSRQAQIQTYKATDVKKM